MEIDKDIRGEMLFKQALTKYPISATPSQWVWSSMYVFKASQKYMVITACFAYLQINNLHIQNLEQVCRLSCKHKAHVYNLDKKISCEFAFQVCYSRYNLTNVRLTWADISAPWWNFRQGEVTIWVWKAWTDSLNVATSVVKPKPSHS